MNTALLDRYRCLESLPNIEFNRQLSDDTGYFRFGHKTICYGRSATGFRSNGVEGDLYDAIENVTISGSDVVLPFDPTEIIDNLRLERYTHSYGYGALPRWKESLKNTYYFLRPLLHLNVRRHVQRAHLNGWRNLPFPHWPVDTTVEDLCEQLLLLCMRVKGVRRIPFIWFWPDGAESCVAMTHDVDTERGRDLCAELMDIDDSFGIRASIQLVPEGRYKLTGAFIDYIRKRGFEVNIQDLNHDGHLFRSHKEFLKRAQKINEYGRTYVAKGFRAAILYRRLEWLDALEFSFDMSVPNVAHLDPQRGGCCTVMPFFIGNTLEIPLTTTQDYMLFHLLSDYSLDLWKAQTELIAAKNGLVSFIVHPDYVIKKKAREVYRELLSYLRQLGSEQRIWFAVPGEIDDWWRARSKMRLLEKDGQWQIEGLDAERAKVAFASMVDDRIEYEVTG